MSERKLLIWQDEDAENPREWDNLGTMICLHKRHLLGDWKASKEFTPESLQELIQRDDVISLPLYLFDHSGLTISTSNSSFRAADSHGWDWGLLGYIYVTKEEAKKEGLEDEEKIMASLRAEVEVYNQFLQGDVWGFSLVRMEKCSECGHTEEVTIDSCGGFYGRDPKKNGMEDHVNLIVVEIVYQGEE